LAEWGYAHRLTDEERTAASALLAKSSAVRRR
jgi:hypothetical protein